MTSRLKNYHIAARHELLDCLLTPCLATESHLTFTPVNVFLFGGVETECLSDAAIMIVGSQVTHIMRFFLRRNIGIARDRAWDQTVASRGKGPDFWQPYVEEWENPPRLDVDSKPDGFAKKWLGGWFGMFVIKNGIFHPKMLLYVIHHVCLLQLCFLHFKSIPLLASLSLPGFGLWELQTSYIDVYVTYLSPTVTSLNNYSISRPNA